MKTAARAIIRGKPIIHPAFAMRQRCQTAWSADIVLVRSNPREVAAIIELARAT